MIKSRISSILILATLIASILIPLLPNPVYAASLDIPVSGVNDDCRIYWDGANWVNLQLNAGTQVVGYYTSSYYKYGGGMRFQGITIPQGATITSAHITFYNGGDTLSLNNTDSTFTGEDVDNAATFSTTADYKARRGTVVGGANNNYLTTATVNWDTVPAETIGQYYDSPDIKTIVQEIVNRAGWTSGNSMVMFWDDHADRSTHTANTYRGYNSADTGTPPSLYISWTSVFPELTTSAATDVGTTTATLNGNITAVNGASISTRGFVWDTVPLADPGNVTPAASAYSNNHTNNGAWSTGIYTYAGGAFSQAVKYYVRACAKNNNNDWGYGSEVSFVTCPDPPSALTATVITGSRVDLAWTNGAGATGAVIRYRTDGVYPTSPTNGQQAYIGTGSSYSHTTSCATAYKYSVYCYRTTGGVTSYSLTAQQATVTTSACSYETFTGQVGAAEDDCKVIYDGANFVWQNTANALTIGYWSSVYYKYGSAVRFSNVNIPQGAHITSAKLVLTCNDGTSYSPVNATIYGVKEPDTGVLGTTSSALSEYKRRRGTIVGGANNNYLTTAYVYWDNIEPWVFGSTYDTPDFSTVVQEIVNQSGWVSGNHMAIFVGDHEDRSAHIPEDGSPAGGAYRDAYQYEEVNGNGVAGAARIVITYESASAPSIPVVATIANPTTTSTSAVLTGSLTSLGNYTPVYTSFQYGTTTNYSNATTEMTMTAIGGISANLSTLQPNTTYYYRARVRYGTGVYAYGTGQSFTTSGGTGAPLTYEALSTGQDGNSDKIYGANWSDMQFTVGATSHTVTSIHLYLKRLGSPGTVTVSMRSATGGVPTGVDLVSTTFDGNLLTTNYDWYSYNVSETTLTTALQYSIIVRATAGDTNNCVYWGIDTGGGLADAVYGKSTNSGATFATDSPKDALFEIWSSPISQGLQIMGARVFTGYMATGDWLIVADVNNVYPPYYPDNDPQAYFQLQLISGTTIKASTPFKAWERQPLAIYLSPATAGTLTWGSGYIIRIQCLTSTAVAEQYTLLPSDWNGGGIFWLDSYIRSLASAYQTYYTATYLVATTDKGNVLNAAGGVIFDTGIPYLSTKRPDLFQTTYQSIAVPPKTFTHAGQAAIVWSDRVGTQATSTLTEAGDLMGGVSGKDILGFLAWLAFLICSLFFMSGNWAGGAIAAFPVIIVGIVFGGIELQVVCVLAMGCWFVVTKVIFVEHQG